MQEQEHERSGIMCRREQLTTLYGLTGMERDLDHLPYRNFASVLCRSRRRGMRLTDLFGPIVSNSRCPEGEAGRSNLVDGKSSTRQPFMRDAYQMEQITAGSG